MISENDSAKFVQPLEKRTLWPKGALCWIDEE